MPRLIVIRRSPQGAALEEKVYDLRQDQIVLGRHEDCDVPLMDRAVSRRHAEIVYDRHDYYAVDLDSGNGTQLNGKPLHFIAHLDDDEPSHFDDEITDTDIIEIKMIKKVLKSLDADMLPSLLVASGPLEGKTLFIAETMSECTIGRDEHCTFAINDQSVSRTHAVVERKWGGLAITDLDSKNGTFVNGERIREKRLADGDQVVVGTVKLLYRNPHDVSLSAIHREYEREPSISIGPAPQPQAPVSPPVAAATPAAPHAAAVPDPPAPSPAAQATAGDRGPPPPDDAEGDLFADASAPESTPKAAPPPTPKPPKRPMLPVALTKLPKIGNPAHLFTVVLLALGGVVFLGALIALVWILMK